MSQATCTSPGKWLVCLHIQDYKSLCALVTICATLVVPKRFLSIVTHLTPKSRSNPGSCCIPVRRTQGVNLVTAGQLLAEIMQI